MIKDLYGEYGGIFNDSMQRLSLSPWSGILSSVKSLKDKGIDLVFVYSEAWEWYFNSLLG